MSEALCFLILEEKDNARDVHTRWIRVQVLSNWFSRKKQFCLPIERRQNATKVTAKRHETLKKGRKKERKENPLLVTAAF